MEAGFPPITKSEGLQPEEKMIDLRDIVAHQYDQIDHVEIWNIITTTLLPLQEQLRPLLPSLPDEENG